MRGGTAWVCCGGGTRKIEYGEVPFWRRKGGEGWENREEISIDRRKKGSGGGCLRKIKNGKYRLNHSDQTSCDL